MKKTSFLIAGKHAVTEALKNPNRGVLKIYLTEDSKKILNKDYQHLNLLKNIKIHYKTKKELDRLCSKDDISYKERQNYTLTHFILRLNIYNEEEFNYEINKVKLK